MSNIPERYQADSRFLTDSAMRVYEQTCKIYNLHIRGMSGFAIAHECGISLSNVSRTLLQLKKKGLPVTDMRTYNISEMQAARERRSVLREQNVEIILTAVWNLQGRDYKLKDIAKATKLSVTTVFRVLKENKHLLTKDVRSDDTRKDVKHEQ